MYNYRTDEERFVSERRDAILAPDQYQYVASSAFEDLPIHIDTERDRSAPGARVRNGLPFDETLSPYFPNRKGYPSYQNAACGQSQTLIDQTSLPVQLSYASLEDAESGAASLHYQHAWYPQSTVPETQEECTFWVSHLMAAILDTSSCLENRTKGSFPKRWAPSSSGQRNSYYQLEAMELTCWKLFDCAVNLHRHGTAALAVHDDGALQDVTQLNQQLSFSQRVCAICDLLRSSKTRCDKLMKGEFLAMTVACPKGKLKDVETNGKNNKTRQELLEMGRETKRQRLEAHTQEQMAVAGWGMERKRQVDLNCDDDTYAEESAPRRKRQRKQ
ncbi:uncharacterized protein M421DRAFT_412733 [Didymella exigua CBS 183.55]|uniref:Uncharacterized protein n=1 Tax=Didymella exigua CBS 183.55 TaxID=1150837 RepID=A0A6A5RZ11_9PLEO|nr:uncharacterized protein M421DRAFT_412733 [Didymella exigua CBS 183.55]KAF1930487.1 hypothetical protein M421DRAFT_412733 [Didymella exigua CBS 183.55]